MIRKANKNDIPSILHIYEYAHQYMRETNNPNQWPDSYPGLIDVEEDIANDSLYVYEDENKIIGVFAFYLGEDENYQTIFDGNWKYSYPYDSSQIHYAM